MSVLAALATVPGREAALAGCLRSLRPQVDRLAVICHDMREPPAIVRELADAWHCRPDRLGSAAKLEWARTHAGLYLGCDDDIAYPPDYVATMWAWVKRWKARALVTCHGRTLKPHATSFHDESFRALAFDATDGAWINYPGGCAFAFDTRLNVPAAADLDGPKSTEEAQLAVWAQRRRVPIWLVPHRAGWLRYLLPEDFKATIWAEEKAGGFERRNSVLAAYAARNTWRVYRTGRLAA